MASQNIDDYELVDVDEPTLEGKSASSGSSWKTWITQKAILTLDKYSGTKTKSSINRTGKITPDEFLKAGDYLVENFPSWKWCKGVPGKQKSCLPHDKQYLITRNISCIPEKDGGPITQYNDEEWNKMLGDDTLNTLNNDDINIQDLTISGKNKDNDVVDNNDDIDDDDIDSLDDFDYSNVAIDTDDDAVVDEQTIYYTRTYDIHITYDNYYATPRVWLFGYDEKGEPLKGAEWQKDFSKSHVNKTVTFESHTHEMFSCPTVHPCNHATAMLKIIKMIQIDGANIDVRLYLLIFLKLVQTIIPSIACDFTGELDIDRC